MCENNWEATGPWEPSSEKMADAVRVAWSLVRLQWETVAHGADSERAAAEDAQIAIYEQYDARTLVIALTIVGGNHRQNGGDHARLPGGADEPRGSARDGTEPFVRHAWPRLARGMGRVGAGLIRWRQFGGNGAPSVSRPGAFPQVDCRREGGRADEGDGLENR
jgi:hypothetical protein